MHIRQIARSELFSPTSGSPEPWLVAASDRLRSLPDPPLGRILVAEDAGLTRAVLGLELRWAVDGRVECATIRVIGADPADPDSGVVTRLIRFAEGIAHVNRCDRVHLASGLGYQTAGTCRDAVGPVGSRIWRTRDMTPRFQQSCR